jgi:hypothetical protein
MNTLDGCPILASFAGVGIFLDGASPSADDGSHWPQIAFAGGPHLPQLANVGFEQVLHLPEGNTSSNPSISFLSKKTYSIMSLHSRM